jgi:hypothetical protein
VALSCGATSLVGDVVGASATPALSKRAPATVRQLGPLSSVGESATSSFNRDGGFSVALPSGRTLWIFGDTLVSRRTNRSSPWRVTFAIPGSSAALGATTVANNPGPLSEVSAGGFR